MQVTLKNLKVLRPGVVGSVTLNDNKTVSLTFRRVLKPVTNTTANDRLMDFDKVDLIGAKVVGIDPESTFGIEFLEPGHVNNQIKLTLTLDIDTDDGAYPYSTTATFSFSEEEGRQYFVASVLDEAIQLSEEDDQRQKEHERSVMEFA